MFNIPSQKLILSIPHPTRAKIRAQGHPGSARASPGSSSERGLRPLSAAARREGGQSGGREAGWCPGMSVWRVYSVVSACVSECNGDIVYLYDCIFGYDGVCDLMNGSLKLGASSIVPKQRWRCWYNCLTTRSITPWALANLAETPTNWDSNHLPQGVTGVP